MHPSPLMVGIILVISIIGLSSAVSDEEQDIHSDTGSSVPVGIIVMKSGFVSDIGTEYSRSFDMALQGFARPPVLPVIVDGGENATVASAAWKELINTTPDLPVVVTVASWTTNVVYPHASDNGIIQLALGSAAVNRSRTTDHLIRFTPGVGQESPVLASYLSQFDRVALLGGENDYTRAYFSSLDTLLPGKICLKSYYNPNNVTAMNTSPIFEAQPDVIVLLGFSEGAQLAAFLRGQGITTPLAGTRGIESNALAMRPEAEGLVFTTPLLNTSHPFFSQYTDEYGENATFYGAEGFDAMTTLCTAARDCNGSADGISSWYQNRTWNGSLGLVSFDTRGVASYPIELKVVHNGTFEKYPRK